MATNILKNSNLNPFDQYRGKKQLVIFVPTEYRLSLLVTLSPISLRVLLLLASRLNSEGFAIASLDEVARFIRTSKNYANAGVLE